MTSTPDGDAAEPQEQGGAPGTPGTLVTRCLIGTQATAKVGGEIGKDLTQLAIGAFSETANEGVGFGLGFAVTVDEAKAQITGPNGIYYWGGAASTIFWIDPVEEMIAILMTQLMPSGAYPLRRQFQQLVYAAIDD